MELQRLLRLLADAATKAEQEAYAAGWRDCRIAMLKALGEFVEEPHGGVEVLYDPLPEMNGGAPAQNAYAN